MSRKIRLTDREKEMVRWLTQYIKAELWNAAFSKLAYQSRNSNSMLHVLAFLKENGIDLWHKITELQYHSFYKCSQLKSVTIPDGVTAIYDEAFCQCNGLTEVTIPKSVVRIGEQVFQDCSSLTEIKYNGTKEQWWKINKDNYWYDDSCIKTIKCSDGPIGL